MPTVSALDDHNNSLSIFAWNYGSAQKLIANTTSANVSNAVGSYAVTVYTVTVDQPVLFEHRLNTAPTIGTGSHYLAPNIPYDIKVRDRGQSANTYFAFQAVSVQANVYISPRG